MDSAAKESILSERLSERLGGLIFKNEQKLAVEALMSGKDVLAVFPTGFGKSVIYQNFVIAKDSSSVVVIVLLRSLIDDQLQSNDFGLKQCFREETRVDERHCCQQISTDFCFCGTSAF